MKKCLLSEVGLFKSFVFDNEIYVHVPTGGAYGGSYNVYDPVGQTYFKLSEDVLVITTV